MKHFFQNAFTKIKNYFTANTGRKIFFFGGLVATLGLIVLATLYLSLTHLRDHSLYFALRELKVGIWYFTLISLVVAGVGTLWDSMYTRYLFLKKVRDMQYNHLKEIYEKQDAGEAVEMTSTFSEDEKKYIRRRKLGFIGIIIFKVAAVIALFSLLLGL